MKGKLFSTAVRILATVLGLSLLSLPATAQNLVVSGLGTGDITRLDASGTPSVFVSGLDKPAMVKWDQDGNLFVFELRNNQSLKPRVLKLSPLGEIFIFQEGLPRTLLDEVGRRVNLSYLDMTISANKTVFLLVRIHDFDGGPLLTEVWELQENTDPGVLASFVAQTFRFTFGPGGNLYLAANGKHQGGSPFNNPKNHIIAVTPTGDVSSFFEFPFPNIGTDPVEGRNLIDVRFDSNEDMFLLVHEPSGSNFRSIWKVQNGVASLFAELGNNPGFGGDGALTMTIDGNDNLFVVGGGSSCNSVGCSDGFIQKIDKQGGVTTFALFPNSELNAMFYIDDDHFDSFPGDDSDGDGILDEEDGCPNSDLTPTVVIDGCDSGVDNTLFVDDEDFENGCTIADLIMEIATDAHNHGQFVSHTAHLANSLNRYGIISGRERGRIQGCAARSSLP